ncbi:MAG: hypothetical protein IIZ18_07915, partial [Ruminococcus sp.]|nr:hypothetical protein [Ruminococcus sp.]
KKGSGKRFQRGKTKGKKGEEMPIFVGFNLFLPLFPLGLSPLGTSVKQTNLVKETCDLNNSPKINAAALDEILLLHFQKNCDIIVNTHF